MKFYREYQSYIHKADYFQVNKRLIINKITNSHKYLLINKYLYFSNVVQFNYNNFIK
jgi:hypothetical protein